MANKTIEVTEATFEETIGKSALPVIVDFWADWCPPCKMIAPVMEDLATEYAGRVKVCKVNVDNNPKLASRFGVRSIPTILFFKDGEIKDQVIGALPRNQFVERLNKLV
jgi:thioredoxin 1